MYDLIIVGSGPAGLSAAVYGIRAGLKLLVLEQNPMSGGQVLNTSEVDNYLGIPGIGGFELGMKFREHAQSAGAEFQNAAAISVKDQGSVKLLETSGGEVYEAKTLILAMGAEHALLHVPGEQEWKGKGVSYCATCDGAFFKGREVAVVGGGDVAVEDAIYLSRICSRVHLIHRRDRLRAAVSLQNRLFASERVEVHWNRTVSEIYGQELVKGVALRSADGGGEERLEAEGVFIAVGMRPNTEIVRGLVERDEAGYIKAKEDCATSVPGIFAAGDIRTKRVRQIVTAVSDGACAVAGVEGYLS